MNRTEFEVALSKLICDILGVDNFDRQTNILGIMAAYDVLYIISLIESALHITAAKLFETLQYTDMSIDALTNKIYGSSGVI